MVWNVVKKLAWRMCLLVISALSKLNFKTKYTPKSIKPFRWSKNMYVQILNIELQCFIASLSKMSTITFWKYYNLNGLHRLCFHSSENLAMVYLITGLFRQVGGSNAWMTTIITDRWSDVTRVWLYPSATCLDKIAGEEASLCQTASDSSRFTIKPTPS